MAAEKQNVLILAPHPDDEVLGCGGTICNHTARGDRAVVVFLTSGELGLKHLPHGKAWQIRETEAQAAARILKLSALKFLRLPDWTSSEHVAKGARLLRPVLQAERPRIIYLPHPREWHPDHQAALPILRAALRGSRLRLPELRGYEVWTPLAEYDRVENITAAWPRKLRALQAHRSQLDEFDYERAVAGLSQFRGELAARCRYAEVFQTLLPKAR
jgi:LmbE family N-acetylglucosaminyl deacetylase